MATPAKSTDETPTTTDDPVTADGTTTTRDEATTRVEPASTTDRPPPPPTTADAATTDRRTPTTAETDKDDGRSHDDSPAATGTFGQDLLRGAVGGLVAGAVFLGLAAWSTAAAGGTPFDAFRWVSTIVLGGEPDALGREAILLGAAIHVGFSLLAGLLFALAAPLLRRHDALVGAGVAFGGLLYVANLLLFGQEAYPLFEEADPAFGLAVHLLFGALLAATFAGTRLPWESARDLLGQRLARAVGALSAAGAAFLYLALADQYLGDDRYVGALVVAAAVAMAYVAIRLARRASLTAWIVGVLASLGMITLYVLVRTTDLLLVSDSGGLLGLAAVVASGVFLLAFIGAMIGRRRNRTRVRKVSRRPSRADMSAKEAEAR